MEEAGKSCYGIIARMPLQFGLLTGKFKEDTEFAKDQNAQLYFIYQRSPYFEKSFRRYPVTRLNKKIELPLQ